MFMRDEFDVKIIYVKKITISFFLKKIEEKKDFFFYMHHITLIE